MSPEITSFSLAVMTTRVRVLSIGVAAGAPGSLAKTVASGVMLPSILLNVAPVVELGVAPVFETMVSVLK